MNRVKQLVHAEDVYRMGYTGKNIRVENSWKDTLIHKNCRVHSSYEVKVSELLLFLLIRQSFHLIFSGNFLSSHLPFPF